MMKAGSSHLPPLSSHTDHIPLLRSLLTSHIPLSLPCFISSLGVPSMSICSFSLLYLSRLGSFKKRTTGLAIAMTSRTSTSHSGKWAAPGGGSVQLLPCIEETREHLEPGVFDFFVSYCPVGFPSYLASGESHLFLVFT